MVSASVEKCSCVSKWACGRACATVNGSARKRCGIYWVMSGEGGEGRVGKNASRRRGRGVNMIEQQLKKMPF